jgi:HK97 family phage prohead protease
VSDNTPYGDVAYADPGYQKDGKKRYPIDTADHVRAAWSYINQSDNAALYSPEHLASIKARIRAAAKKFGIQIADDQQQNSLTRTVERRNTIVPVEVRASGKMVIGGYAAKFDKRSDNLGGFIERVGYGFFNKSMADGWPGVLARYNHNDDMLLGTTDNATLRLNPDASGLPYDVDINPEDPQAMGAYARVKRGDVRQSSFAFVVAEDEWGSEDGLPLRTLVSGRLIDVAPVVTPAYQDTSVGLRSLATRFDADPEEVRQLAARHELMRFFKRTDDTPKGPVRGSLALARIRNVPSA